MKSVHESIADNIETDSQIILKSHYSYEFFDKLFHGFDHSVMGQFHIFHVWRGMMDCMTSLFHFLKNTEHIWKELPHYDTPEEFLSVDPSTSKAFDHYSWQKSKTFPERWARHVSGWFDAPNVTHFTYEKILSDPSFVVDKISNITGMTRSHDEPVLPKLFGTKSVNPRKGVVGDWVNTFTPEQAEAMIEMASVGVSKMARLLLTPDGFMSHLPGDEHHEANQDAEGSSGQPPETPGVP